MPALSTAEAIKDIAEKFESIDAYLQAANEILHEGHMPDIADLDNRIAELCSDVEKAPSEIQGVCLRRLDDLLLKLNDCEDAMTSFQIISAKSVKK
jgi:hypothetical protein